MSNKATLCESDECWAAPRLEARWFLLELLGNVCGVDASKCMLKWARRNLDAAPTDEPFLDAMYTAPTDEPFVAVCSLIVRASNKRRKRTP